MKVQAKEIELVSIDLLVPHPKNMNKHPDSQIERLAKLIEYQGFRNPVVVQKGTNLIVAGHGRLLAAKKLGYKKVPVTFQEFDSDAQLYAYMTSDNAIASWAELDLAMVNPETLGLGPDFDIDMLGIKDFVLEPIEKFGPQADEDAVPEVEHPITRRGDLWILGKHRLLCGDSTMIDDVKRLIADNNPNLMVTDPPYGVKLDQSWRDEAMGSRKMGKGNANIVENDDKADWYDAWVLFPGNIAYVWHASSFSDVVMDSLRRANFDVKQQIIWNKNILVMGRSYYHWKHEPCWYAVRKGAGHNWLGDRKQTTVWDAAIPNHIMSGSKDDKTDHPTQKPLIIYEKPIQNHTRLGDWLYEPFGGSGSGLIACEKHGRYSATMELSEKYCDVIIKRWEQYTGQKAKLESTGQTYEEIKVERDGATN
jgi:DNA modification methylase